MNFMGAQKTSGNSYIVYLIKHANMTKWVSLNKIITLFLLRVRKVVMHLINSLLRLKIKLKNTQIL